MLRKWQSVSGKLLQGRILSLPLDLAYSPFMALFVEETYPFPILLKDFLSCLSNQRREDSVGLCCDAVLYVTSKVKERAVKGRQSNAIFFKNKSQFQNGNSFSCSLRLSFKQPILWVIFVIWSPSLRLEVWLDWKAQEALGIVRRVSWSCYGKRKGQTDLVFFAQYL